jgi:cation diffusion facilitator family transporter
MKSLKNFIYLSIAAAFITIMLKFLAWYVTDSVGLLSDALESCVNLIAALIALIILSIAEKPADDGHIFGHGKAEYFSGMIEGILIIIAAILIIKSAIPRIINPKELENVGIGLIISTGASVVNLIVAIILIKNGKKYNSIILEADGKHLMTDVYTSIGVFVAIGLVKLTGLTILDGIIGVIVAINILWTGYQLISKSTNGLLDSSLSKNDLLKITDLLKNLPEEIDYHKLQTRQSGQQKFIEFHLLVPDNWTVKKAHDLADNIENNICNLFILTKVIIHIEPKDDPLSYN